MVVLLRHIRDRGYEFGIVLYYFSVNLKEAENEDVA